MLLFLSIRITIFKFKRVYLSNILILMNFYFFNYYLITHTKLIK